MAGLAGNNVKAHRKSQGSRVSTSVTSGHDPEEAPRLETTRAGKERAAPPSWVLEELMKMEFPGNGSAWTPQGWLIRASIGMGPERI